MKRSEIAELSDKDLWIKFYWVAVRSTNEANSRRGFTNKQEQQEIWFSDEICKRFGWDKEEFYTKIRD